MADNPHQAGEPDRSQISLGQEHEVRYWTKRFNVSEARLKKAVIAVGSSAVAVEKWLREN